MTASLDDEIWRKFFELYRNLPEIWNVRSDEYKNPRRRNHGWEILLEVYRVIDKSATVDKLKHRVSNIRTCYRRELNKIRQSEKYGSCPEDVHVPTLWYFNMLDFLKDQENNQARRFRPRSVKDEMNGEEECEEEEEEVPIEHEIVETKPKRYRFKNEVPLSKVTNNRLHNTLPCSRTKDEAAIYADSWACSYRKMLPEQQLYAKKAIEEVLILGQLNALTVDTVDTSSAKAITKPEFEEIFDPHDYSNENEIQCCMEKI